MFKKTHIVRTPNWSYTGVIIGVIIVLLIALISILGGFDSLDGFIYDFFARHHPHQSFPQNPDLLLIEIDCDDSPIPADTLLTLLEQIENLSPKVVAFNFIPANASDEFFRATNQYQNVILSKELGNVGVDFADPAFRDIRTSRYEDIIFAYSGFPPIDNGISRKQYKGFRLGDETHKTLEVVVTEQYREHPIDVIDGDSFLINFSGYPGSIPTISLERVLSGDLLSELVKGKIVMIGYGTNEKNPGFFTPVNPKGPGMSLLRVQAYAVRSLQYENSISKTGIISNLIILLTITIISLVLYQWTEIRLMGWLTAFLIAFYILITYVSFNFFDFWFPITEIFLSQIILFIVFLRNKSSLVELGFQKLLTENTLEMRDRYLPTSFFYSKEYWNQAVVMVRQVLDLNRLIFLESIEGDNRVEEVKSFNCSLSDIDERRRDYTRFPYSTAIERKRPFRLEERNFFKKKEEDEEQYIVALTFAGRIMGFWVFGIQKDKMDNIPNFESLVRDYSNLIGELLYHRREIQRKKEGNIFYKYLISERSEQIYKALRNTIELMKIRLANLASLLGSLTTAMIVYDLFGRVIEINSIMLNILQKAGIAPYEKTLLDLISEIADVDLAEVQNIMRQVIIQQEMVSLTVTLNQRHYILNLSPLAYSQSQTQGDENIYPKPFGLTGILCELLDSTSAYELKKLKEELSEKLTVQIRNDLSTMQISLSMLSSPELPADKKDEILKITDEKISETSEVLEECVGYLTIEEDSKSKGRRFPVSPVPLLSSVIESVSDEFQEKSLTINCDKPMLENTVLAAPERLKIVFKNILAILITDAANNSEITVNISEEEKFTTFFFANEGFGMPNDRFQSYLKDETSATTPEFSNIRNAYIYVQEWGGTLEATSTVGGGMEFSLKLRRFI